MMTEEVASWVREAKPGDKVICIDDGFSHPDTIWFYDDGPEKGQIYTIQNIWNDGLTIVFDFIEKTRDPQSHALFGCRVGYGWWRFKPVQKNSSGMETLIGILNNPMVGIQDQGSKWDGRRINASE
jgi:hypothetical protein